MLKVKCMTALVKREIRSRDIQSIQKFMRIGFIVVLRLKVMFFQRVRRNYKIPI